MAKVVGSYASVTRGVSEQVAHDRHPGQMWEQVNMVSDPVRGVSRRHGSRLMDEKNLGSSTTPASCQPLLRMFREHSFFVDGVEYSLLYRSQPKPVGPVLPMAFCFNKDLRTWLSVVIDSDPSFTPFDTQGFSTVTSVGKYLVAAGNGLLPGYTNVDNYTPTNQLAAAWVRGGEASRTFTLTYTSSTTGLTYTGTYRTMASSYPNPLDTSDIPLTNPDGTTNKDYQKQVNDRVNAWQSASTKWLGDSFASRQPNAIAQGLQASLWAAGAPHSEVDVIGSTVYLNHATSVSGTDSGDDSLLRVVHNELESPDKVSANHYYGKVVKIRAKGQLDAYYLKAVASGNTPGYGAGPVTWEECPANTITPTTVFAIGLIQNNTLFLAATQARLEAIASLPANSVPRYQPTKAGDLSAPGNKPYFLDHPISHLTVFQDRLAIISNGVVFLSRSGDYFNWFRDSMLTSKQDDPCEGYALGSEDDIITKSVLYSKDLFLFGLRKQYAISGRTPVTPQSLAISTAASERSASYAQPAVIGNLLFYGRSEVARDQVGPSPYASAVSQFQLGVFQDVPETSRASMQLDKYIRGRITEFAVLPSPTTLFARTDGLDNGLYVYSFIDAPATQQRQFDSWSRWEWDYDLVGHIIGMVGYQSSLFVYTLKHDGSTLWLGAEEFVIDSDLSDTPYMDSQKPVARYEITGGFLKNRATNVGKAGMSVALDSTTNYGFLGDSMDRFDQFKAAYLPQWASAWVGVNYVSQLDITPPYVRDSNDRAIVNGNLTITQYTLSLIDTGGVDAWMTSEGMSKRVSKFNGRILGRINDLVGRQPITSTYLSVPCGKANIRHRMQLVSRKWLPFGLSAIEWAGQFFSNARRVT